MTRAAARGTGAGPSQPRPPSRWLLRACVVGLSTALALLLSDLVLPGLTIDGLVPALAAAVLLGMLNVVLWPPLMRIALPLSVLTLGLFPLLLSAGFVVGIARLLPGITIDGLFTALVATLVISVVTTAATGALSVHDEEVWARVTLRRAARRSQARRGTALADLPPGVVFIQIDGLGHDVLRRALRDGDAPTLASWVRSGSHHLSPWETDWSSQTGASQAGILLGSNFDMPAFRWLEKETDEIIVSNRPSSAAEIERRQSTGRGLLRDDGVSRGNLFSGDAPDSVLTLSVVGRRRGRVGSGYQAYFASPYNTTRTLTGVLAEVLRERRQARAQRRQDIQPRVHRGGAYPWLRAFTTVISRDVLTTTIIGDMFEGRSAVYADYVGYDEVSHHSGVERHEALATLRGIDREIGRIARAAQRTPRPYRIVVLSDHGQSQGATFLQRYGHSLADLAIAAAGDPGQVESPPVGGEESWGYAGAALAEVGNQPGLVGGSVRGLSRRREVDGDILLGPELPSNTPQDPALTVLASGNLGLIYLRHVAGRVTRERIDELYPQLIPTLVNHPGIGFILVATATRGPVVLGAGGELYLETGLVIGEDPLAAFGPRARTKVRRTNSFPHCADIMVNSTWDPQTDEVAAFEELVGSHGGLGGGQSHPFVLHPAELAMPGDVLGAEALHRVLVTWLPQPDAAPSPDAAPPAGALDAEAVAAAGEFDEPDPGDLVLTPSVVPVIAATPPPGRSRRSKRRRSSGRAAKQAQTEPTTPTTPTGAMAAMTPAAGVPAPDSVLEQAGWLLSSSPQPDPQVLPPAPVDLPPPPPMPPLPPLPPLVEHPPATPSASPGARAYEPDAYPPADFASPRDTDQTGSVSGLAELPDEYESPARRAGSRRGVRRTRSSRRAERRAAALDAAEALDASPAMEAEAAPPLPEPTALPPLPPLQPLQPVPPPTSLLDLEPAPGTAVEWTPTSEADPTDDGEPSASSPEAGIGSEPDDEASGTEVSTEESSGDEPSGTRTDSTAGPAPTPTTVPPATPFDLPLPPAPPAATIARVLASPPPPRRARRPVEPPAARPERPTPVAKPPVAPPAAPPVAPVAPPVVPPPIVIPPVIEPPAAVVAPVVPEPVVPDPVVPDPALSDPVVPESAFSEPVITQPVVTEPVAWEPVVTEPAAWEPVVPEPVSPEPVVPEFVVPEPVATLPTIAEPAAVPDDSDTTDTTELEPIREPILRDEPVLPQPPLVAEFVAESATTEEPVVAEPADPQAEDVADEDLTEDRPSYTSWEVVGRDPLGFGSLPAADYLPQEPVPVEVTEDASVEEPAAAEAAPETAQEEVPQPVVEAAAEPEPVIEEPVIEEPAYVEQAELVEEDAGTEADESVVAGTDSDEEPTPAAVDGNHDAEADSDEHGDELVDPESVEVEPVAGEPEDPEPEDQEPVETVASAEGGTPVESSEPALPETADDTESTDATDATEVADMESGPLSMRRRAIRRRRARRAARESRPFDGDEVAPVIPLTLADRLAPYSRDSRTTAPDQQQPEPIVWPERDDIEDHDESTDQDPEADAEPDQD